MPARLPSIVDNRGDNTALNLIQALMRYSRSLDVATGCFEVGSLLALEGDWQKLDKIRVLMGDSTTRRTRDELVNALRKSTRTSLEEAKVDDDGLTGLDAIRQALAERKINVRVYTRAKFHAKAYLFDASEGSPLDFAMVGSSNFSRPGLTTNIELNLLTADQGHIAALRQWFEELWEQGEESIEDVISTIQPHLRQYDPFTVYCLALQRFFDGREKRADTWELTESKVYKKLSQYQKDGYHTAMAIAERWGGALVCDAVGLGKTFIGLMLIERHVHDGKNVLLIVPKSARSSVWERHTHPPGIIGHIGKRQFYEQLRIFNHTDFGADDIETSRMLSEGKLEELVQTTDVIIIDEAHHFRNPLSNRGRHLKTLLQNASGREKTLYMLTATPVNNTLDDLYYLINYFTNGQKGHFKELGINDLRKFFLEAEKKIQKALDSEDAISAVSDTDFLRTDELLKRILIQRSRKYVKDSEVLSQKDEDNDASHDGPPTFPVRQVPRVINYSLRAVYETLYGEIKEAFDKDNPLLSLAIYNPSMYHKEPDKQEEQRQRQLIGLIRTLLLKRLESSFTAFQASVEDLLDKVAICLKKHAPEQYETWTETNRRWWSLVQKNIEERLQLGETEEEDELPAALQDFDPTDHHMDKFVGDLQEDMRLLTDFLSKIYRRFYQKDAEGVVVDPTKDDKLQKLMEALRSDPILKGSKVVVFTEFRDTAKYLGRQLEKARFKDVEEIDSTSRDDRDEVIKRFAPFYNCTPDELPKYLQKPVKVLISTDVLSEGLNLQDASLIINYDLHWNPVRLMQRIGRVDRRMDPAIEEQITRRQKLRGKVYFWNFLPPKELDDLLGLRKRLDGKITRINKTLGIEGALLTPDDPDRSLKEFNEKYEGKESIEELMNLERQAISERYPELWCDLIELPMRLFSGKVPGDGFQPIKNRRGEVISELQANMRPGLFCCYLVPSSKPTQGTLFDVQSEDEVPQGDVRWYFRDAETGETTEDLERIWTAIRCAKGTKRKVVKGVKGLVDARKDIEKHLKNTYLKAIQAPVGVRPILLAWMEMA